MNNDLKPCPFCNGRPEIISDQRQGVHHEYVLRCTHCNCAPFAGWDKPEALTERWNRRPIEERLEEILYRKREY